MPTTLSSTIQSECVLTDSPLSPPALDDTHVARLTELARQLDGSDPVAAVPILAEFNSLAGTSEPLANFQNIPGGSDYETYVRSLLTMIQSKSAPSISREELTAMFQKLLDDPCDDTYVAHLIATVKKTFGDEKVSDLVFWPGEYFGDGNNARKLTAAEMADVVLDRKTK